MYKITNEWDEAWHMKFYARNGPFQRLTHINQFLRCFISQQDKSCVFSFSKSDCLLKEVNVRFAKEFFLNVSNWKKTEYLLDVC